MAAVSVDVSLGRQSIVNTNATIDHDDRGSATVFM